MMKHLLLKMAKLPEKHQRWILNHLPEALHQSFIAKEGPLLLKEAKAFSRLKVEHLVAMPSSLPKALPKIADRLSDKSNLFTAIVLHEGQFDWMEGFLKQQHHQQDEIQKLMKNKVLDIKKETRQLLFQHWMNEQAFDDFIGETHG